MSRSATPRVLPAAAGDLPAAAVLEHPNGARVYLVGSVHVDPQSASDAREVVERVAPAILVLELDPERFAAGKLAAGDKFDTKRIVQSDWELAKMALRMGPISPEAYISSLEKVAMTHVLGTLNGAEMVEAADAASRFDAFVVLADRDHRISRARQVHALVAAARRARDDGALPAKAEVGPKAAESTWAQDSRLLSMARAGGCASPKAAVEALTRLKRAALLPQEGGGTSAAPLNGDDFLEVRDCGRVFLERYRKAALTGDADWDAELEALTGAHGAEGFAGVARAVNHQVVVDERDVILTSALWRAARTAGPRPVVGVVGAGHVAGITRLWQSAGEPGFAAKAREYEQMPPVPPAAEPGSALPGVGAFGLFVVLAGAGVGVWRRPRTAKYFAGLVGVWGAYRVNSALDEMDEMKRHGAALERVAATARAVENGTAERGGRGGEGRQ